MTKKVYVGQLWRTLRGVEWQVSALYRPVVGAANLAEGTYPDGGNERPVYGEQHAILYSEHCKGAGPWPERHVPVAKLLGHGWHWKPVE